MSVNNLLLKTRSQDMIGLNWQKEPSCPTTPNRPPNGRASARWAKFSARPRSSGERPISTCSCRATASMRSRATPTKARRRSDAPLRRPWRTGGSAALSAARLQVARLTKALRCAEISLEEGNVKTIAPFLTVARKPLSRASILDRPGLRLHATWEASQGRRRIFCFFACNPLKSPDSEKFMKTNESNFAFICFRLLSFSSIDLALWLH